MKIRLSGLILIAALSLGRAAQAELVTGVLDISTANTYYDAKDLIISNGTLTVQGMHTFGTVSLIATSRVVYPWTSSASNSLVVTALSVDGSSSVDLGGGTRLTALHQMWLDSGAVLTAQAINNGGTMGGQWLGTGPEIQAGALMVATNAVISAEGQGHGSAGTYDAPGTGPGGGGGGTYYGGGGGGGHGGRGGIGARGAGGTVYGSALVPTMLGSGAGSGWNAYGFRRSGGAVKVSASLLRLDGRITANGQDGSTDVGGGSGGSIWVQAGTLEGSGWMQANGGVGAGGCGGGGGGRIAVYYGVATGYTASAQCVAAGGTGYAAGEAGSVGFFNTNVPGLRLDVFTSFNCTGQVQVAEALIQGGQASRWGAGAAIQVFGIASNSTVALASNLVAGTGSIRQASQLRLEGGGTFTSFSLTSTSVLVLAGAQLLQADTIILTNAASIVAEAKDNGGLVAGQWAATGVMVQAKSLLIATNCFLATDGQGYGSAGSYAAGGGPGGGSGGAYSSYGSGGGGGGHGGAGGTGRRGGGGAAYGSAFQPVTVGSGGGAGVDAYAIRRGGGAIKVVADLLRLDGVIRANGQDGQYDVGGGSGGSLLLNIGSLEGAGSLQANGGAGGGTAGGGGGGRIAVHYGVATGYTAFTQCTASGGAGWAAGEAGSVGFFDTHLPGRVFVYYSFSSTDHVQVAEVTIQGGQTTRWSRDVTVDRLDVSSGSSVKVGGNASFGLLSLAVGSSLQTSSNAVITTGQLQQASQMRLDGGGVFSNLTLVNTSSLTMAAAKLLKADTLSLTNASSIVVEARDNGGQVGGQWIATGGVVQARSLGIGTNCVLSADGQGYGSAGAPYAAGVGPGGGVGGAYSGYGSGGGGGGHGGPGGTGRKGGGGASYGSLMIPTTVGSGGGTGIDGYAPQRGGGAMNVVADLLRLDGVIRANGQNGQNDVGGGAGGSLLLNLGVLEGAGSLQAKGGAGGGTAGGGGGGRIALYTGTCSNFTGFASCSVAGGPGWATGGNGTLFLGSTWESWEARYWPAGGSGGRTNDFDGDGLSNEQEYLTGTNPADRNSSFKVLSNRTKVPPQGVIVQWTSQPDRLYAVDRATNLWPHAVFLNLQSGIQGQAGTTTYTDSSATTSGFYYYRVRLMP